MLLVPEGALILNAPAAAALELVDGKRELRRDRRCSHRRVRRRTGTCPRRSRCAFRPARRAGIRSVRPLSLFCELTYRCNLQCPYCYNPARTVTLPRRALDGRMVPCLARRRGARRRSSALFGRRADAAARSRRAHCGGVASRPLHESDHARDISRRRSARRFGRKRSRSRPDQHSSAGSGARRSNRRAPSSTKETRRAAARRERDVALTLNCVLHRPNHDRIDDGHRVCRAAGHHAPGARERAVLRVGLSQSRRSDADAASKSCTAKRSSQPRASACADEWRSSTFSPITSASSRSRA